MEPTSFTVKEESQFKGQGEEFVKTKLMTRLTYTLDEVLTSMQLGMGGGEGTRGGRRQSSFLYCCSLLVTCRCSIFACTVHIDIG